jgi:hypothetical protein
VDNFYNTIAFFIPLVVKCRCTPNKWATNKTNIRRNMSINKLKSIVRRGTMLGAAFAVVAATFIPAASTFADALNPLTERSLTLSSSSPGWSSTDGSGNSTYAPPNSGANGNKTGNYFSFKVSSDSTATPITDMSFQYCTTSAGLCAAPGNDTGTLPSPRVDDSSHTDLNVNYPSAAEISSTDFSTVIDTGSTATAGNVKAVPGYTDENPKYQSAGGNRTGANGSGDPAEAAKAVVGNFVVMKYSAAANAGAGGWVYSPDWAATSSNQEEATSLLTGKNNTIVLHNTATGEGLTAGTAVKVLFFATATNYITNPGEGAFFVKINTFKHFTALTNPTDLAADIATPGNVLDGGVTVANVMNQSIQITTKVLETMQFSVGTVDPDTLTDAELNAADGKTGEKHTPCDTIRTAMVSGQTQNVLALGNQDAESSLETGKAYATHSYWRLSSNSSAGATVYYSGHTLSDTSGDEIQPIGTTAAQSAPGSEQFGLAIASTNVSAGNTQAVNYVQDTQSNKVWENAADNGKTGIDASVITDLTTGGTLNASYHAPRLDPLTADAQYANGSGRINGDDSLDASGKAFGATGYSSTNAQFAFDPLSDTIPAPIATESTQVVDCVSAKMRYIGNIAATTPAGIYTTKINYIAAPQY